MIDLEKYKRIMARNEYSKLGYTLSDSAIAELISALEQAKELITAIDQNWAVDLNAYGRWISKFFGEK